MLRQIESAFVSAGPRGLLALTRPKILIRQCKRGGEWGCKKELDKEDRGRGGLSKGAEGPAVLSWP